MRSKINYNENYNLNTSINTIDSNTSTISTSNSIIATNTSNINSNLSFLTKNNNESKDWIEIYNPDLEKYFRINYYLFVRNTQSNNVKNITLQGNLYTYGFGNGQSYELMSRSWIPIYNINKFDFYTLLPNYDNDAYDLSFGLVKNPRNVNESSNDVSLLLKIYYNSGQKIKITFNISGTQIIYDNDINNNLDDITVLPSNLFYLNKWSIIMHNDTYEFYTWNKTEMKLFHTHSFLRTNQSFGVPTMKNFSMEPFVFYAKIKCNNDIVLDDDFISYVKFKSYALTSCIPKNLSFYKLISSSLITKETNSTNDEAIFSLACTDHTNNKQILVPVILDIFLYTKNYDCTFNISYYRSSSSNSPLDYNGFMSDHMIFAIDTPSSTDSVFQLSSFYLKNDTEKIERIYKAYMYLGPNITDTDRPHIYLSAKCSSASTNIIYWSLKIYGL